MTHAEKAMLQANLEERKTKLEEFNKRIEEDTELMANVAKALGRWTDIVTNSIISLYKLKGVYEGNIRVLELMLADEVKDE